MIPFKEAFSKRLYQIKIEKPLIHHITNFVTMNDSANITLAIGASPIMAFSKKEVEEITSVSKALVLNIGTPDRKRFQSMELSIHTAKKLSLPIVLDPVGIGSSSFRRKNLEKLFKDKMPSIIKGNFSEIMALDGNSFHGAKGVDSTKKSTESSLEWICHRAKALSTVLVVTGETDIITDGTRICTIERGSPYFTQMTGAGCMSGSLIGAFLAVEGDPFWAAVYGLCVMNLAGERAQSNLKENESCGMFKVRLIDAVELFSVENFDWERGILFEGVI